MALTLNGTTNTIGGLAVGGLPDGIVDTDMIAASAVTRVKSNLPGSILQVVQTTKTDTFTTSAGSFTDITGMSVSITPSSASNKVLVTFSISYGGQSNLYAGVNLVRGSTNLIVNSVASGNDIAATVSTGGDNANFQYKAHQTSYEYLDSPNTTSATTYKLQAFAEGNKVFYINRNNENDNAAHNVMGTSTITVKEVAG